MLLYVDVCSGKIIVSSDKPIFAQKIDKYIGKSCAIIG